VLFPQNGDRIVTIDSVTSLHGATENARPENAGLENDGQLRNESQGWKMQDWKMTDRVN